MTKVSILLIVFLCWACTQTQESNTTHPLVGEWKAQWKTSPSAFPEVTGIEQFSMNGQLVFDKDGRVEIAAYGFPGCIFSSDTMRHKLQWKISNDTLSLMSENDPYGMPYSIIKLTKGHVELKLMDDIFLTLERKSL